MYITYVRAGFALDLKEFVYVATFADAKGVGDADIATDLFTVRVEGNVKPHHCDNYYCLQQRR